MSFSSEVKEELAGRMGGARHCQLAELAALLKFTGTRIPLEGARKIVRIDTENFSVAKKCFTLLRKTYSIRMDLSVKRNTYSSYQILAYDLPEAAEHILIQNSCCRRAFIRGAFLAAGSVSDPGKGYHFEIVCETEGTAEQLQEMIRCFAMGAKITRRKKNYVVYVKEGSQIADLLTAMEAHVALMNFENVRILKEMRNSVNRQVNCETANLGKTVSAAVKQIEDIRYIQKTTGFEGLPENLAEMAVLRLEQPEATLKELGQMLDPPVGKSGVNHRLRKLSAIADGRRGIKEERHYD